MVAEWRNDEQGGWYCYWDESYGMPDDRENNFVFKPPLETAHCNLVRTADWKICANSTIKEVEQQLTQLFSIIEAAEATVSELTPTIERLGTEMRVIIHGCQQCFHGWRVMVTLPQHTCSLNSAHIRGCSAV